MDISAKRRLLINKSRVFIGSVTTPTHAPFTKTLVVLARYAKPHSFRIRISALECSHSIIGLPEHRLVIFAKMAICLCNPILAPSGVSTGSIIPHCEPCNKRGPTILALESKGKLILRISAI